ncbi:MAG TPA: GNAT family N-acetyltransferase [Chryseolinea sp.]|nr:GNAT family N-acetyltransferase [Chryseolinea sp.]
MEVREATEDDIPQIVELLRASLGESLMPKSEAYWRWKHIDNPFGRSAVLLCWEGEKLIGVRAFMRWEWVLHGRVYKSVRAVDTATHPQYQGKGIFRKLTLELVDRCKVLGDQFVFNTPNEQSKPGYLKMGWTEAGRLPIGFVIRRPVNIACNLLLSKQGLRNQDTYDRSMLGHPKLHPLLHQAIDESDNLMTNVTVSYLRWRYEDVPVASYFVMADQDDRGLNGILIGRAKATRFGLELRVVDCFGTLKGSIAKERFKKLRESLRIDYMTFSGMIHGVPSSLPTFRLPVGPTVTVRPLANDDLGFLANFSKWSPSIGDLELF